MRTGEIADARVRLGFAVDLGQGRSGGAPVMLCGMSLMPDRSRAKALLRLLPPPRRLAPLLRAVPARWQRLLLHRAMTRLQDTPPADASIDFIAGRRLGIDVSDLGLRWSITLREGRLVVVEGLPEASVHGSATDLMLLATRLEDADTLFEQHRLTLTGDPELRLAARRLLDHLPWTSLPLGLRIALVRGARLARAARDAHRHAA